jgi:hypothetical protein
MVKMDNSDFLRPIIAIAGFSVLFLSSLIFVVAPTVNRSWSTKSLFSYLHDSNNTNLSSLSFVNKISNSAYFYEENNFNSKLKLQLSRSTESKIANLHSSNFLVMDTNQLRKGSSLTNNQEFSKQSELEGWFLLGSD